MAQHHFAPVTLPFGKNTTAHWSTRPNGGLVIFVHGFGGKSLGTWLQFPTLLPLSHRATGTDIIFFGYDGLRTRAYVSAVIFHQFLDALFDPDSTFVNKHFPARATRRERDFSWSKVVVVAHSLGSIVSRLALMEGARHAKPWAPKVRLMLFAPAHTGANVAALASEALVGLPGLVPGAKYVIQALQDLEPGCQTLTNLASDVQTLLPNAPYLRAASVILGEKDHVVNPNRFVDDPMPILLMKKGHMSVCKPDRMFQDPISHLEALL